jgi:hypothetical protein
MNQYDIACTFAEMVSNGHTKFHFRFELVETDGITTFEDFFYLSDAETIVEDMELELQTDGVWQVWKVVGLE